eukprot:COSAG01_NODE_35330_length_533_cov_1.578341_1_plen_77_part_10
MQRLLDAAEAGIPLPPHGKVRASPCAPCLAAVVDACVCVCVWCMRVRFVSVVATAWMGRRREQTGYKAYRKHYGEKF